MPTNRSRSLLPAVAVLFGLCTLVFGAAGRIGADGYPRSPHGWIQVLFESAGLLVLQPPAERSAGAATTHNAAFSIARVSAVLFVFLGAVSVLIELYRPARDAWLRSRFWWARTAGQSPAIVIGLDPIGGTLVRELRAANRPVYVVTDGRSGPAAAMARRADALVIEGAATDEEVRGRADLRHAREVFLATGNDARNVEIAAGLLRDARETRLGRRVSPLQGFVHAGTPSLAGALGSHRLLHDSRREIVFRFFNLQEQAARDLLLAEESGLARLYAPDDVAHYLVLGFGDMGQAVALQMGRLAHFSSSRRLRLTVIDDFSAAAAAGAPDARAVFLARYPGFAPDPAKFDMLEHRRLDVPDKDGWDSRLWRPADPGWRCDADDAVEYAVNCEFADVPGTFEGSHLLNLLLERIRPVTAAPHAGLAPRDHVRAALVICFDDEARNLRCALSLREALEAAHLDGSLTAQLPVYVYLAADRGFARLLEESPEFQHSEAVRLHVFGAIPPGELYDRIVRPEIRTLAARIHASYRQEVRGPAFDDLPPVLQASNVDAAAHLVLKRDALHRARHGGRGGDRSGPSILSEAEIALLARMEHNRWMAERLIAGYRMGEQKSKRTGPVEHENRRRPSMMPWERLSQTRRSEALKDVRQILALLGTPPPPS